MKEYKRPAMLFSDRYFIDELFRMHCQTEGSEYCVMNFISWIKKQPVYSKQLLMYLMEEEL